MTAERESDSPPRPGLVFNLIPWRRPTVWTPVVDAVYAARDLFLSGADEGTLTLAVESSPAQEPVDMAVAKAPAKAPRSEADATPSRARLEAAVRKAATTKAQSREAKAALKSAKKEFRLARKAAKAARKDLEALQAVITSAEERAAAAAKRARTTKRVRKTDQTSPAAAKTTPPAPPKPARKTRRAAAPARSDAEVVYTEPLATSPDTLDGSSSTTSS